MKPSIGQSCCWKITIDYITFTNCSQIFYQHTVTISNTKESDSERNFDLDKPSCSKQVAEIVTMIEKRNILGVEVNYSRLFQ